jgi:hypothetical protein
VRIRIWFALRRAGIAMSIPASTVFVTHETPERDNRKLEREMDQRLRALDKVDLFSGLSAKLRRQLADHLELAPFARGEAVTHEGAKDDGLYMIVEGEAVVRIGGGSNDSSGILGGQDALNEVAQRENSLAEIAPSVLSADFTRLGEHLAQVEEAGASIIHVDVMDGHFVPNITIGPFIVNWIRQATRLPISTPLRFERPGHARQYFAAVGRDQHVVLDPHAAPAGDVHARLDGEHHARLDRRVGVRPDRRPLVDFQADPVAQPVVEPLAVPRLAQHRPGRRVDVLRRVRGWIVNGCLCLRLCACL